MINYEYLSSHCNYIRTARENSFQSITRRLIELNSRTWFQSNITIINNTLIWFDVMKILKYGQISFSSFRHPNLSTKRLNIFKTIKMGNNPSQLAIGEASATQAKKGIDVLVSDYVEFLESTSALIDENIEDLGNEIAMATAQFRVSDEFKALSAEQQRILQEDVEKHANLHKHAVRRVFAILSDAYDTFEDMSYAITQPEDAEDLEDNDDYEEDDEEVCTFPLLKNDM